MRPEISEELMRAVFRLRATAAAVEDEIERLAAMVPRVDESVREQAMSAIEILSAEAIALRGQVGALEVQLLKNAQ